MRTALLSVLVVLLVACLVPASQAGKWGSVRHSGGPQGRHASSCINVRDNVVLFGGLGDDNEYLNDIWDFAFSGKSWTKIPTSSTSVPAPRAYSSAIQAGAAVILGFGEGPPPTTGARPRRYNDMWEWDDNNKQWSQVFYDGDAPSPRSHTAMGKWKNFVYVFGGRAENGTALADFNIYNTQSRRWTLGGTPNVWASCVEGQVNDCYPSPRWGTANVFLNDYLLMFGGYSPAIGGDSNDLWVWDVVQSVVVKAETSGPGPSPRRGATAIIDAGHMWVYGGYSEAEGYMNDLYRLDVNSNGVSSWKRYSGTSGDMPLLYMPCAAVSGNGLKTKFYVMMGAEGDRAPSAIGNPDENPSIKHPDAVYAQTINQTGFILLIAICCSVGFIILVIGGYCFYSRCYVRKKRNEEGAEEDPTGVDARNEQAEEQMKQRAIAMARLNMMKEQRARIAAAEGALQAHEDIAQGLHPGGDGLGTDTVRAPALRRV